MKRIHTSLTLPPEIMAKIDEECDAKKWGYEFEKSRTDVIESALRYRYGMPQVSMGRKRKRAEVVSTSEEKGTGMSYAALKEAAALTNNNA